MIWGERYLSPHIFADEQSLALTLFANLLVYHIFFTRAFWNWSSGLPVVVLAIIHIRIVKPSKFWETSTTY